MCREIQRKQSGYYNPRADQVFCVERGPTGSIRKLHPMTNNEYVSSLNPKRPPNVTRNNMSGRELRSLLGDPYKVADPYKGVFE